MRISKNTLVLPFSNYFLFCSIFTRINRYEILDLFNQIQFTKANKSDFLILDAWYLTNLDSIGLMLKIIYIDN